MRREGAKARKREARREEDEESGGISDLFEFLRVLLRAFAPSRRMFWRARNRARLFSESSGIVAFFLLNSYLVIE
jgi:hypothetical protein